MAQVRAAGRPPEYPRHCPASQSRGVDPQENVWQFMRDHRLSNRVFTCYDAAADHCADTCNKLFEQPWRLMALEL